VALSPMNRIPEWSREIAVPDIVIEGPPGDIVELAIGNPVGLGVKITPPTVRGGVDAVRVGKMLYVWSPIIRIPEGAREIFVPAIVAAGLPAEIVVPPTAKPIGLGVKACPPIVNAGGIIASPPDCPALGFP